MADNLSFQTSILVLSAVFESSNFRVLSVIYKQASPPDSEFISKIYLNGLNNILKSVIPFLKQIERIQKLVEEVPIL